MVEFTIKNPISGEISRRSIRTSEIREFWENSDGTTKIRISDVALNGDYVSYSVAETYDDVKNAIEKEQREYLARFKREK